MVFYNETGLNNLSAFNEEGGTSNEDTIVGAIYLSLSLFYLGPYVMCMILIYTDKKLISKPYYLIVVHMGLTDIMQLVFNGITAGVFTLFNHMLSFWVNKFIGGLMNFCWVMYCFLAHALAFNRFVNLFWPLSINKVFSMKNTKILISLIWIYGLTWFTAYMCPNFNLIYLKETYNWDYDVAPASRIGWLIELINDCTHAGAMVIWYSLIFIKLKLTPKVGTLSADDKKEMKVLMQAFMVCFMVIVTIVGFFGVPYLGNKWATFASNLIWLACAGNNSLVYYIFNSSIRNKALAILRCKKNSSISPGGDMNAAVFQITRYVPEGKLIERPEERRKSTTYKVSRAGQRPKTSSSSSSNN